MREATERVGAASRFCASWRASPESSPIPAQGRHEHRLHDQQDVFAAGVVRAQLGALGRVQAAGEERAEDSRLDGRPVQGGDPVQNGQPVGVQVEHDVIVEQPAVEVTDCTRRSQSPSAHGVKELLDLVVEALRVVAATLHQAGEQLAGQQVDVFGKEAESRRIR